VVNRGLLTVTFLGAKNMPHLGDLFLAIPILGIMVYQALSGRPVHVPAAEQMQMQVVDRLPAILPCVHDDPVTVI
jgi:hypothetical protein